MWQLERISVLAMSGKELLPAQRVGKKYGFHTEVLPKEMDGRP